MGHKENAKVILGPAQRFIRTVLQQCKWNTCAHFNCK